MSVDQIADGRFELFHLAREIHGDFGLLAVHRTEFHGDLESFPRTFPAPVTRHGLHARGLWASAGEMSNVELHEKRGQGLKTRLAAQKRFPQLIVWPARPS